MVVRTLAEDTEFEGYTLPKGAWMSSNIYGVHHSPEIWEDPEVCCKVTIINLFFTNYLSDF